MGTASGGVMGAGGSTQAPRALRLVAWLLPAVGLLAWQLAMAVPAQARAGDLDPGFGTGGKVVTDFGGTDQLNALALQLDGKLVAAGVPNNQTGFGSDFGLARYRAW